MDSTHQFHSPFSETVSMQRPTLQNVRIRSTRDAMQVFHGVATHRLPLITRRLDAEERRAIVPGNVYVWEERGANTEPTGLGMERWTDGMGWGPSRVRDEFLFYHQKESDMGDDLANPITPWAQMMRRPSARPSGRPYSLNASQLPESERLIKQTYSVHVSLPDDRARGAIRKWHLTAYFSQQKLDELQTIDDIRNIVGDVPVPDGWFKSARTGRLRREGQAHGANPHSNGGAYQSGSPPYNYAHQSSSSSHHYDRHASSSHHMSASPTPSDYSSTASSSSGNGHMAQQSGTAEHLVPLEYLRNVSAPRRDPADEQLLRRFHLGS